MKKRAREPRKGTAQKPSSSTTAVETKDQARRRRWFVGLAALVLPLALLVLTEAMLRFAGYGYSTAFFREKRVDGQKVLMENPEFGRRFFPAGLVRRSQPFTISSQKKPNTIRIFVLGESAAMGDPDFKFGLPRMLEVLLREHYPEKKFEVINAALVAINSHVILPIARDCAKQQADLWVIYMGNNEIIGPFGSASVFGARTPALPIVRAGLWLKTLRLGQLLDAGIQAITDRRRNAGEWRGMEMMAEQKVPYDAPETEQVHQHFERNVRDILESGTRAGVRIVLSTIPTNLKNCAPFASTHKRGLGANELAAWQLAYQTGGNAQAAGNWKEALKAYGRAAGTDDDFADLAFRQGQCFQQLGQSTEAGTWLKKARDLDALQFRADSQINTEIRRAAGGFKAESVTLLDAEALFASKSPENLTGREYFYEHVHLTPEGNYLLARAVAEECAKVLSLESTGEWISKSECFRLLGLTDWNRYDAFNTILERIQQAPFTHQLDHAQQVQVTTDQLERLRPATKPVQVRRQATQVAQLVSQYPNDAELRWNLAALLEDAGDSTGAEQQWRALLRLQPRSTVANYNLGKLLEANGRQTEAVSLFQQCLKLDRDFYAGRYALGSLLLKMGQTNEAIQQLKIALKQRPDSEEARQTLAKAWATASYSR